MNALECEEEFAGDLLGKKLVRLEQRGSEGFSLHFADGTEARFDVFGDCCSSSWIEHLETPVDLEGATLMAVSSAWMDTKENAYDVVKSYETTFVTDRGAISVEYRNSSNGYYGGNLVRVG